MIHKNPYGIILFIIIRAEHKKWCILSHGRMITQFMYERASTSTNSYMLLQWQPFQNDDKSKMNW